MTTMVASHHGDFWQQRSHHTYHMSNMSVPGLMSPFEPQRSVTNTSPQRTYHQSTSTVEMSLPLFSSNGLPSSVAYQSGAFAFDPVSVNPYNMQQAYPMGYVADVPQNVSYARSNLDQQLPAHQEACSAFCADSKIATTSPLQSSPSFHRSPYGIEIERSRSEPLDTSGVNFATDIDTLMKAIQAKQTDSPQISQANKVLYTRPMILINLLTQNRKKQRSRTKSPGKDISVICPDAVRVSIRRHTWRSTSALILAQNHL